MNSETEVDGSENESENVKVVVASTKKHTCPYVGCSLAFDRPWKLETHLNNHTNQRPFKCTEPGCTKAYTNNSHLQRHKSVSHAFMNSETEGDGSENESENVKVVVASTKKHTCPYVGCSFAFDRPWKLETHLNTHTNQRPFKCTEPGCTKAYTNNSHLQRHKSVSHAKNKPPPQQIPCPFPDCKKVYANKWSVKRHVSGHYASGPYKCVVCGEGFKKYWELKYHVYAHWGLDPFVCDTCKESFKTRPELKRHERKHKIYNCDEDECFEKFDSWNALRAHMKVAHPNKYDCHFCQKCFKNKWTLGEHVMSHLPLDERNIIVCPYTECGRYYFYERNLEAHIKSIHHDMNFKCEFSGCDRVFTSKRRLKDHERRHVEPPRERIKSDKPRKPRKDKGLLRKSMAATLSGVVLPKNVEKDLAQNNITLEVEQCIKNIKEEISEAINNKESDIISENIFPET